MSHLPISSYIGGKAVLPALVFCLISGCATPSTDPRDPMYLLERQWDSKDQILMSEASQVKLRSIQTQIFENPREEIFQAVVATMQDLGFLLVVADAELGVISGKKLQPHRWLPESGRDYVVYEDDALLLFAQNYRTIGPFHHRKDLVRLTVTIRPKNETLNLVRASVQYELKAMEAPVIYERFFNAVRNSSFFASQKISR